MKRCVVFAALFLSLTWSTPSLQAKSFRDNRAPDIPTHVVGIQPGSTLHIIIYGEEDLSGDFEVKQDGTITFPLVGRIKMMGLTLVEAEDKINECLRDGYLVNPSTRISIVTKNKGGEKTWLEAR